MQLTTAPLAMSRKLAAALLIVSPFLISVAKAAGDAASGEASASTCVSCHGELGASPIEGTPIIAGQHEDYLLITLRAYKTGERSNPAMASLIAGLSDIDLQNLAAYFASQESGLQ